MSKETVEPGTIPADSRFRIAIDPEGPYRVYGMPPLEQAFIIPDGEGASWQYQSGDTYPMQGEFTELCRCGGSANKPFCDGSHASHEWDPQVTASTRPILEDAEMFGGPSLSLSDNESYCAYARFCDARGRVWNIVGESDDPQKRADTIWEAEHCPGARLSAWDNQTERPFEPEFEPSLAVIEDPALGVSAGLWVRGGIRIERPDGVTYEIRNRVALCRCGQSENKPYCNGAHASVRFRDGLNAKPDGKNIDTPFSNASEKSSSR